jgi:hypothetical protein
LLNSRLSCADGFRSKMRFSQESKLSFISGGRCCIVNFWWHSSSISRN